MDEIKPTQTDQTQTDQTQTPGDPRIEEMLQLISTCHHPVTAALAAGFSLKEYAEIKESLADRITQAEAKSQVFLLKHILDNMGAATARWLLERRHGQDWGRRRHQPIRQRLDPTTMSNQELLSFIEQEESREQKEERLLTVYPQ